MSARLFAVFALQDSNFQSYLEHGTIPEHVRPLMPLLKSLVHVEMTSLEENNTEWRDKEGRRVHFSGFDCSSIKPPVESLAGSEQHQSDSIDALTIASHHVKALLCTYINNDAENTDMSPSIVSNLNSIITFFDDLDSDSVNECAKVSCS